MPTKIGFRLPQAVVKAARATAHERGLSFSQYVNGVVNDFSLAVFGKRHAVYEYQKKSALHKRRRVRRQQCAFFPGSEGLLMAQRLRKSEVSTMACIYWQAAAYRRFEKICRAWRWCGYFSSKNDFLIYMLLFPR